MIKKMTGILLALVMICIPAAASAESIESEGSMEFTYPSEDWEAYYSERFSRTGEDSGFMELCSVNDANTETLIIYLKSSEKKELNAFSDMKGAEQFYKDGGKDALLEYFDEKLYYDRNVYDGVEDVLSLQPVKVIKGADGNYLRIDVSTRTYYEDEEGDTYGYDGCIYMTLDDSGVFRIFHTKVYLDDTEDSEEKFQSVTAGTDELVKSYADLGCDEILLQRIEKETLKEKFHRGTFAIGYSLRLILREIIFLGLLAIILAAIVFVIRRAVKGASGEGKIIEKKAAESSTAEVHCTYEDSLKTLLKSGLLTKKEYAELMKKHEEE